MTVAPPITRREPPATEAPPARPLTHPMLRVLAIWALSRVVTTVLFVIAIRRATHASRIGAHSTLLQTLTAWDGQWYQLIARNGYPAHLPIGPDGVVQTNAWAFLPAYPYLAKLVSFGVPAAWPLGAVIVSLAFGTGSAVLMFLLFRGRIGERPALHGVAVFAFSPLSFVLQAAYAESMALCLLLAVLVLFERERYLAAIPPTLVLAFTRPGVQAIALTIAIVMGLRLVRARRGGRPVPVRSLLAAGLLAVVAFVSGFAWTVIAGVVTHRPNAYLATELAWRQPWLRTDAFRPFVPWLWSAWFWFGRWGPVALAVAFGGTVLLVSARRVRALGGTVVAWTISWFAYLLAVFFPQSSIFRLALVPLAPLTGAVAPRSRWALAAALVVGVFLQGVWLLACYTLPTTFWNVP